MASLINNAGIMLMPRPTVHLSKSPSFYTMTQPCLNCGNVHWVEVPDTYEFYKAVGNWHRGAHVQDAMHMLDTDTREQFISGMTPWCWSEFTSNF